MMLHKRVLTLQAPRPLNQSLRMRSLLIPSRVLYFSTRDGKRDPRNMTNQQFLETELK